mgnify:FL=1
MTRVSLLFFALIFLNQCAMKEKKKVDFTVHNATIYTVDEDFSQAQAMAVSDGKIVATGTNEDILDTYEGKAIDLAGKYIYPGLIDAHCHFMWYGLFLQNVDLTGTQSFEEVIERVKGFAEGKELTVLQGRGWDQNDWEIQEYPDKTVLDSLFPDIPVYLGRIDGHAALVNQKALDMFDIDETTEMEGGKVVLKDGLSLIHI